ncbi:MAG: acriflavine resistance protein B [Bdellovibrionales bacterium RBG_16_40_8]|nr:MAG: acriflavine resistance protein B [Bdellovibrionales bacterium RBG_16_40_8]
MNLTRISIERPVFAWMLMFSLLTFGLVSFKFLGVSSLPDVDFPVVNISVGYAGASPEVMESDVIDILENAVMGAEGLKDISSSSRYGSANITLEFDIDRNVDLAMQEVQSKVSQALKRLPSNVEPPVISKQNPEDQPIMWLAVSGSWPTRDLMAYARDKMITQFQLVPGVGDVFLGGFVDPNIRVWVDGVKLKSFQLSIDDVISAINREHVEKPAGLLQQGDTEYTLRVVGEARTAEELSEVIISRRGGSPIYSPVRLKDVSRIEVGLDDVRRLSRVRGEAAVGIGIRKQRGTNAVEVADKVKAKMLVMQKDLPKELTMGVNFDSTKFIKETIHELEFELILSALLTALVCWLFLGSLQSTINILIAIPTSLIGTFIAIKFFHFTLNSFTFLGLILCVGIVVDDAIMVLENIIRHKQMGKTRRHAAQEGTDQISFAAMATTLAIVAIFLPVAFMEGIIGKFFFQFGVTISIAVLISLLEALTLTPMRCSQFLEKKEKHGALQSTVTRLTKFYSEKLKWCLSHRLIVITFSIVFFLASLLITKALRKEFVPSQDQGMFMVRLITPIGSSLSSTDNTVKQAEAKLLPISDIKRFFVAIGGFGGGQVNTAIMFITLKDLSDRKTTQKQMMDLVRKEFSSIEGLRTVIQDLSTGGFGSGRGFPIEFSVRGPDWDKLVSISKDMTDSLRKDARFVDIDTNYDEGMPEVRIIPNRARATQLGVSVADIGQTVGYLIGGDKIARFTDGSKRIDIRVRLDSQFRDKPDSILNLFVRNNRGELIKLRDVADLEVKKSLVSITRQARERAITIYANVASGASQAAMVETVESLRSTLPEGYSIVLSGSSKSFSESFSSLVFALWFGIIIAYMILASQFNSFVHGFTVLLALPFSISGAFFSLWIAGASLNIYSMIGLILLMGIAKKNSIMLVDFTNQKRNDGLDVTSALLEACPTRLRPVLMTSITIIAASIPPVLGLGPGTETRSSMSLAIIGGVFISTILTLFVVPCVYSLFARQKNI